MCEDIRHIGRDMAKIEFSVMAGNFVPVIIFGPLCPSYPPITGFIMLFGHQNLVIDICNIGQTVIQKIIFGNGGTFYSGLPFSENFDKGTPLQIFR